MSQKSHLRNILEFNVALIIISTSGVLGRHIVLPVTVTICLRSLIAAVFLYAFIRFKKMPVRYKRKDWFIIFIGGVFMGVHWLSYFYALQLSNVAIGMLSLFTYPVITAILEPVFLKTKFQKVHILLGLIVIVGIYFLVPDFDIHNNYTKAIGFGVFSALCYTLRLLIMKSKIGEYNGSVLMLSQLIVIGVLLIPSLFIFDISGIIPQFKSLMFLALITTATGHTLFLYSLKHFSATTTGLISCIQPVYGILMGMIFLSEFPAPTTIIGGILILASVVIEGIRSKKM